MIVYDPFWKTLERKKISTYALIAKHGFSGSTIDRLKHNKPITTTTINDLCRVLDCSVGDILEYRKDV